MTHVTLEFFQLRPKRFPSLWYGRRKPGTNLASRLALSQNGPNEIPLERRHLGVPSGASKMISKPMVRLAQTVHYLTSTLTTYPN